MKTREEWFNTLPEPERTKAFENIWELEDGDPQEVQDLLNDKEASLKDAIAGAFVWAASKEGNDYWKNIAENEMD